MKTPLPIGLLNLAQLDPTQLAEHILETQPLLRQKLSRALFCSAAETQVALAEVIKFLILASESMDGPLTPSNRVDLAWHEFLLFTRLYMQFCELYLGKLVHHEPSSDHDGNSQQYLKTLARYRQRFGQPPSEYWVAIEAVPAKKGSASCGNCEADS